MARAELWVNFELNDKDLEDQDTAHGFLSLRDAKGEEVYGTYVLCTYDDSTDDKK